MSWTHDGDCQSTVSHSKVRYFKYCHTTLYIHRLPHIFCIAIDRAKPRFCSLQGGPARCALALDTLALAASAEIGARSNQERSNQEKTRFASRSACGSFQDSDSSKGVSCGESMPVRLSPWIGAALVWHTHVDNAATQHRTLSLDNLTQLTHATMFTSLS